MLQAAPTGACLGLVSNCENSRFSNKTVVELRKMFLCCSIYSWICFPTFSFLPYPAVAGEILFFCELREDLVRLIQSFL
jgi:hypothetical protein